MTILFGDILSRPSSTILSVSIPLRNLQDIQKLTLEMNQSEMRPFDDVTLLLGYLPTQPASSEKAE